MDIADFKVDQVWVPEYGIKVNNRRIITRIIYMPYNDKQIRHIYYDVPVFCPACETLIRREGQDSDDLEDFIAWIKAEDAICTSDPEYMLNQLRSLMTTNNGLQAEILQLKATIEDLERQISQAEENAWYEAKDADLRS